MFERKNQNILSEHYNKLIDRDEGDNSEDDFITLKRADHDLEDAALPESDHISKRQTKMAISKKALAKGGPRGTKLIFDDDGQAHELYELKTAEELIGGADEVSEARKRHAEEESTKLKQADVTDKAEAKEKKQERKRKRKEREREVSQVNVPPSVVLDSSISCRGWRTQILVLLRSLHLKTTAVIFHLPSISRLNQRMRCLRQQNARRALVVLKRLQGMHCKIMSSWH